MKIKLVKQEQKSGCTIACIAMILGKTYHEVAADFVTDFNNDAISAKLMLQYIADHGFSVIEKKIKFFSYVGFADDEMFRPFAPAHIVFFMEKFDVSHGHVVVMTEEGKLICPDGLTEEQIRNCYRIISVSGLYPENKIGGKLK